MNNTNNTAAEFKVETARLVTADGKHIRMATRVTNNKGQIIRFMEKRRPAFFGEPMPTQFTHTGRKENVAYANRGHDFSHSIPKPGKRHALNLARTEYGRKIYRSICGETVYAEKAGDFPGQPTSDTVTPATTTDEITCSRCRRKLA